MNKTVEFAKVLSPVEESLVARMAVMAAGMARTLKDGMTAVISGVKDEENNSDIKGVRGTVIVAL